MAEERSEKFHDQVNRATAAFRLHAKEGFLFIDREGRLSAWNAQAVKWLGWKTDPSPGTPLQTLLPPEEPWSRTVLQALAQSRPFEMAVPRLGGSPLMVSVVPFLEEGEPAGNLLTLWPLETPDASEVIAHLTRQYGELKRLHDEFRRRYEHPAGTEGASSSLPNRLLANHLQELTQRLALLNRGIPKITEARQTSPENLLHPPREAVAGPRTEASETTSDLLKVVLQCRGLVSKMGALLTPPPLSKSHQSLNRVLDHVAAAAEERLGAIGIHCDKRYPPNLPTVEVDLTSLTEAIVNVMIAYGASLTPGSRLLIRAEVAPDIHQVLVTIVSSTPAEIPAFVMEEVPAWGLFAAHQILDAHQITLQVSPPAGHPQLEFRVPAHPSEPPKEERATPATIMLVESRLETLQPLMRFLTQEGFQVPTASDGRRALKMIEEDPPDILLFSETVLEREGLGWLSDVKRTDPLLPTAILTGYESTPLTQRALESGAFQSLGRPFRKEEVLGLVQKGLELRRVKQEIDQLRRQVATPSEGGLVMGDSPEMQKVLALIQQVAPTDMTVILQGESGVGKEVVARLLHHQSRRAAKPFIAIDGGALPESLVESELFGYERGAFTGADRRKLGHFELAQGGTLLFDEITNLSAPVQAKLLRVLQERTVQRLGGRRTIPVDVRVITASNVDLAQAVKAGHFREDLYHRLNEFTLTLPPLRKRPQDIALLSEIFRQEANQELGKRVTGFDPRVFDMLKGYAWPGNIRELKNTIKRSVLLAETIVLPEHLEVTLRLRQPLKAIQEKEPVPPPTIPPETVLVPSSGIPPSELKRASKRAATEVEKPLILEALEKAHYNKTEAAKLLGIDRTALYYKMKKFGMTL